MLTNKFNFLVEDYEKESVSFLWIKSLDYSFFWQCYSGEYWEALVEMN